MGSAVPITIGAPTSGDLTGGGAEYYEIAPSSDGRLIVQTQADSSSLQLRLSLYDGQGNLLVESDGQSSGRQDPLIDQHVAAGADFVEVQSLAGSGAYSLTTSLTASSDPGQTVPANFEQGTYAPIAVGDFTGNGILDIVAADGVHLGTGDGTFQAPSAADALVDPASGEAPSAIAVGDFNGDNKLDVAVALAGTDSISISLGNGDGTFQPATTIGLPVVGTPDAIIAGDFTGNGVTDLAVAVVTPDGAPGDVVVLMGKGDGTFTALAPIPVGIGPVSMAAGDFANNGRIDLAVADMLSGDVTILSNQGGADFVALPPIQLPAGATPTSIVAGDFGTGQVDLAVTDSNHYATDILQGNGDGTFSLTRSVFAGANPYSIVAGDFGTGQISLAVADANTRDVAVLLGNGDGTFQAAQFTATGSGPIAVVAGDFNGDGRLDLATANVDADDISVLLGKGDGTFQVTTANAVGYATAAVATGDFTGNGNLGLAVVDQGSNTVTILPGNGDGTFQEPLTVALPPGSVATSIVAADFNGDGRTDLAVADFGLNEVSILLGNGDGTFDSLPPIPVPGGPFALAAGDFTGNGQIDLAVADQSSGEVTILMGKGDGTFQVLPPFLIQPGNPTTNTPPNPYTNPDAIVAGNFTGNGHLDLAVADQGTDDVTVLLGNGDGTFNPQPPIPLPAPGTVPPSPGIPSELSLVAGDFRNDGRTDLAVASDDPFFGDSLDVLLSNGDGSFQSPLVMPIETAAELANGELAVPVAIVAGFFTNNGILDLATADNNGTGTDDYSVYLGNGDGTFSGPTPFALGGSGASTAIVTGDFTGDGRTDLAITRTGPDDVDVRLSNDDGTFSDPSVVDLVRRETPLVADLSGDGAPDVSVVDAAGDILYRAGRPGEPGSFAPPVTVNPGDPSRDIAFVSTQYGPTIASVDADDNAISFFVLRSTGFVLVAKLATGSEPAEILSADLNGNGVSDLIVRNAGAGTISVFPGDGHGWFLPRIDMPVGLGASDIEVADLQQDGRLDIVFSDRISGEIGVLDNLGGGVFSSPVLYRAGPGPYGVNGTADPSPVSSLEATTGVAVGTFTSGGLPSLVALNPGSNTFGLLSNLGGGLLSNPTYVQTAESGLVVRAIDFNGSGLTGLAVLGPDGLYIYVSNGQGGFLPPTEYNVGFEPNGLTVADLTGNGKDDLLVSNPLGDVQVLIGNGDGTFQSVQNLDQQVALAVYAPNGKSPTAFIFADQLTDQLIVRSVGGVTTVLGNASSGLISPTAVALADLNNNGILDLIVANGGSNNVLVYPGLGDGAFGPALNGGHGFFTGTNPAGITVADLTGNGRLDLIIANTGSNDVSILFNQPTANGGFTFVPGPRLNVGIGPVATVVADVLANGVPDLVVADSGSNNVMLLQGLGNGFFNDQSPIIYPVGTDPSRLYVGNFTAGSGLDLVTINAGSNTLTQISGLSVGSPVERSISTGGTDPTAGLMVGLASNTQDDLMVANNGDGNIALFQPGDNGLALSSVLSASGLPNPSSLAFASFNGGNLEFYATTEGEASASLLGFQLEEPGSTLSLTSTGSTSGSAQLVSLNESSLALVGTLLTLTLDLQTETAEGASGSGGAGATSGPGGAGQSVVGATHTMDESEEAPAADAPAQPATAKEQPNPMSWARFVIGLDQAIESLRNEADARLHDEEEPAKAPKPGTTLLDQDDAAGQPATTSFSLMQQAILAASRQFEAGDDRLDAVDMAIGSWGRPDPNNLQSIFPVLPDPTITKTPPSSSRVVRVTDRAELFPSLEAEPSRLDLSQVGRVATLVAVSALAATARETVLRRSTSFVAAGSSPTRQSRWDALSRHRPFPRA